MASYFFHFFKILPFCAITFILLVSLLAIFAGAKVTFALAAFSFYSMVIGDAL